MREAFECLDRANVCETMAGNAREDSSIRLLRDIADQWRRLAHGSDRHKRQTGRQTPPSTAASWAGVPLKESDET